MSVSASTIITANPMPKRISWLIAQGLQLPLAAEYSMTMPMAARITINITYEKLML